MFLWNLGMNIHELRQLCLEDAKAWILSQPEIERQLWGWAYNLDRPKGNFILIKHLYPHLRSLKDMNKQTYQIQTSAGKAVQYVYGYDLKRPITTDEFKQRHQEAITQWHKDYGHLNESLREWVISRAFQAYR